jgi:hypothetical protein
MFLYPRAVFRARVNRLKGEVGRIEIVLAGDPDRREQGMAPGIGQGRAHPMGSSRLVVAHDGSGVGAADEAAPIRSAPATRNRPRHAQRRSG